jgi:hypothetical protein
MIPGHRTRVLLIVALMAVWGCGTKPNVPSPSPRPTPVPLADGPEEPRELPASIRAKAIATGDPELDPLVSYLKAHFAEEIKAGKKLVIESRTDLHLVHLGSSYPEFVESLLKEASDMVPDQLIRDFGDKNRRTHPVWPELTRLLPAELMGPDEGGAIFSEDADTNWQNFYDAYPGSAGLITISRVGLSRDKTRALFYLGEVRGSEDGHGQLHLLEKEGDEWVERRVRIGSSWES